LSHELQSEIADELNVHRIEDLSTADGELVDYSIKANFRTLGTKYGANVQEVAAALAELNAAEVVSKVRSGQPQLISSGDSNFEVTEEDLIITETPRTGWAVASHDGESVALDLTITPELHREGVIREIIRAIQEERKNAGFDVSDRIKLIWNGSTEVSEAMESGIKLISEEVLALEVEKDSSLVSADGELALGLKLLRL
jgi:isoleucyl-tRNA synthetase